jgi:hexokinase
MIPTFVFGWPSGNEIGDYLALDLGTSTLHTSFIIYGRLIYDQKVVRTFAFALSPYKARASSKSHRQSTDLQRSKNKRTDKSYSISVLNA